MPVAIETVIIIIVVISFAIFSAIIFALYWLWRLLLEDRRCSHLGGPTSPHEWACRSTVCSPEDGTQRALLGSRGRNPRISRRTEVLVDERSRRMRIKSAACFAYPSTRPAPPSRVAVDVQAPEVVVLDDTEPPPPYEAIGC